jgi:hypothetical protein
MRSDTRDADRIATDLAGALEEEQGNVSALSKEERRLKQEAEEAEARALELAMDAAMASGDEGEYKRAEAAAAAEEAERKRDLYETRKLEIEDEVAENRQRYQNDSKTQALMLNVLVGTKGVMEALENSYPAEVLDCFRALVDFNQTKWNMARQGDLDPDPDDPGYQATGRKLADAYRTAINAPGVSPELKDRLKELFGVSSGKTVMDEFGDEFR